MNKKLTYIFAFGVLLVVGLACEFSATTANLGDIKLAKDKTGSNPQTTFEPGDEIFAVTSLNNTSGKHKAKFRLLFDGVEGAETGTVAYKLEKEFDVEGSREFWYTFSVPSGFVPGKYKAEFVLMDEEGKKQVDTKTATFTVAGKAKDKTDAPKKESDPDKPAEPAPDSAN